MSVSLSLFILFVLPSSFLVWCCVCVPLRHISSFCSLHPCTHSHLRAFTIPHLSVIVLFVCAPFLCVLPRLQPFFFSRFCVRCLALSLTASSPIQIHISDFSFVSFFAGSIPPPAASEHDPFEFLHASTPGCSSQQASNQRDTSLRA